jgi:hypothetical protein
MEIPFFLRGIRLCLPVVGNNLAVYKKCAIFRVKIVFINDFWAPQKKKLTKNMEIRPSLNYEGIYCLVYYLSPAGVREPTL